MISKCSFNPQTFLKCSSSFTGPGTEFLKGRLPPAGPQAADWNWGNMPDGKDRLELGTSQLADSTVRSAPAIHEQMGSMWGAVRSSFLDP